MKQCVVHNAIFGKSIKNPMNKVDIKITHFLINYHKFKQSPRKSLICQFSVANKRQKLNNHLQEQAETLFLYRKPKRSAIFWIT